MRPRGSSSCVTASRTICSAPGSPPVTIPRWRLTRRVAWRPNPCAKPAGGRWPSRSTARGGRGRRWRHCARCARCSRMNWALTPAPNSRRLRKRFFSRIPGSLTYLPRRRGTTCAPIPASPPSAPVMRTASSAGKPTSRRPWSGSLATDSVWSPGHPGAANPRCCGRAWPRHS